MIAFARKRNDCWWDIYPSKMQVKMCLGNDPETIFNVEVVEDENGPYYGWEDRDHPGRFSMIYDSKTLFDICFPYGPEIEVEKGKGRIVRLTITER